MLWGLGIIKIMRKLPKLAKTKKSHASYTDMSIWDYTNMSHGTTFSCYLSYFDYEGIWRAILFMGHLFSYIKRMRRKTKSQIIFLTFPPDPTFSVKLHRIYAIIITECQCNHLCHRHHSFKNILFRWKTYAMTNQTMDDHHVRMVYSVWFPTRSWPRD